MRLFFAVHLSDAAAGAVIDLQHRLRTKAFDPGIRWVKRAQLHYTLKFLGEVSAERAADAAAAARRSVESVGTFDLQLSGVGAFPNQKAPRVLWVGADTGADALGHLASRLEHELSALGFPAEPRAFKPHLTLARIKGQSAERAAARLFDALAVGEITRTSVDSMALMESHLAPQGATHTLVERFGLESPAA